MVWNYQNTDCVLRIFLSFILIFGTVSFLIGLSVNTRPRADAPITPLLAGGWYIDRVVPF